MAEVLAWENRAMATKDELMTENATLRERIKALEGEAVPSGEMLDADGEPLTDGGKYEYNDGIGLMALDDDAGGLMRVRAEDGTFSEPVEGGVYRYDGSGDLVAVKDGSGDLVAVKDGDGGTPVGAMADEVAMLRADKLRLEVERDDARNRLQQAEGKLRDVQTLHGHVDNLKPPY